MILVFCQKRQRLWWLSLEPIHFDTSDHKFGLQIDVCDVLPVLDGHASQLKFFAFWGDSWQAIVFSVLATTLVIILIVRC